MRFSSFFCCNYTIFFIIWSMGIIGCGYRTKKNASIQLPDNYLWDDSTSAYLPTTVEWTNRVEIADLNYDGQLDIIFANGGNYSTPGEAEMVRVFINRGPGKQFSETTESIFGDLKFWSRVVKAKDLNGDGWLDLIIGNTYQSQSHIFMGDGNGGFTNKTADYFPQINASIGDIEIGDADGDGDLDLALIDWGPGNNMNNNGGKAFLWLNDGQGKFTDVTKDQMPKVLIGFSWDIEWVDYDNDYDLDLAISCKRCAGGKLFINDGNGYFSEQRAFPAYTNNYELEPMDVNEDGFIDFVTVNDGEIVNEVSYSRREHIFMHNGNNRYVDVTNRLWPDSANIGEDDNNVVFLDYDSDGDADFLLSSLTGEDRLLENNGSGRFNLIQPVIKNNNTPHTLSMVLGDINNDCKIDLIMGQGEGENNIEERIFIGIQISKDTAPPKISNVKYSQDSITDQWMIRARIHDNKSPLSDHDILEVQLLQSDDKSIGNFIWYGEYLWRFKSQVPLNDPINSLKILAVDRCGNSASYIVDL